MAVAVGWHAWPSADSPNFQGMGLRTDAVVVDTDGDEQTWAPTASTAPTSDSTTRPAWVAYQRLAELLGSTQILSSRLVWPPVSSRDELQDFVTMPLTSDNQCLVILEFVLNPVSTVHAYLVFVEPVFLASDSAAATEVSEPFNVWMQRAIPSMVDVLRSVDTMPKLEHSHSRPDLSGTDCPDLPVRVFRPVGPAPFAADRDLVMSTRDWARLTFDPADLGDLSPRLIISDTELEWHQYPFVSS